MPRKSVPSYRLHKASGQARTIVNGKHVYLGKFNSEESRKAYARILAESAQPSLCFPTPTSSQAPVPQSLLIAEVIVKYLEFAEVNYAVDGKVGKEFVGMVDSLLAPMTKSRSRSKRTFLARKRQAMRNQPSTIG